MKDRPQLFAFCLEVKRISNTKPLSLKQWRSQNAEKVKHTKGRLLDQAMILSIAPLFKLRTSLKGTNMLPKGANSFG